MTTAKTTAAIETMYLKELSDIERLTTPAVHHAIQRNLSKGFTVEEIARSLSDRAKCSMRVARTVVWDARDADEWLYVSEM